MAHRLLSYIYTCCLPSVFNHRFLPKKKLTKTVLTHRLLHIYSMPVVHLSSSIITFCCFMCSLITLVNLSVTLTLTLRHTALVFATWFDRIASTKPWKPWPTSRRTYRGRNSRPRKRRREYETTSGKGAAAVQAFSSASQPAYGQSSQ